MPTVDFYILPDDKKLQLACRLIEKAYGQNNRVYIHTGNPAQTLAIDQLLWTFRDDSFIPHGMSGDEQCTIQIGHDQIPPDQRDILLNLSHDVPPSHPQFARILEVVANNEQANARERYRLYRSNQYDITTHKL